MREAGESLTLDYVDGVVRLALDRPERWNAIDTATLLCLIEVLDRRDHPTVPLLVEGATGVFSVGSDLPELAGFDALSATVYSQLGHQVVAALERWPGVTIAAVDGFCLGAGLELVLGCDLIVATRTGRFGLPGLPLALMPCLGGLRRLTCRMDQGVSTRLFLAGEVITSAQGLELGLVNEVIDELDDALTIARHHRDWPVSGVEAIRSLRLDRHGAIDSTAEADLFAETFAHGECQRRLRRLIG